MKILDWFKRKWHSLFDEGEDLDEYLSTEVAPKKPSPLKRSQVDLRSREHRTEYIEKSCEQMIEATNEIDRSTMEYRLVTEYLTDMELIDALPKDAKATLKLSADRIVRLERENHLSSVSLGKISEEEYNILNRYENSVPGDIRRMRENEDFKEVVRQDLQKLESEKAVNTYRNRELAVTRRSMRNLVTITIVFGALVMVLLSIMQIYLQIDATMGYMVAAILIALAFTWAYLSYGRASKEYRKNSHYLKAVIEEQNRVKIRFVNVSNVLEYEYRKYRVNAADELEYYYEAYMEEKRARDFMERANSEIIGERTKLLRLLRNLHLKDPAVWLNQCVALTDPKEMVEIRHDLIQRRQSLRKRIEYNTELRNQLKDEINGIVNEYPEYGQEILDIVASYDR